MEVAYDSTGLPWLDQPVKLHSSREPDYDLTPEQFAYVSQYWLFWYEADHRYALPTVAFFVTAVILFSFGYIISRYASPEQRRGPVYRRSTACLRYLSYKSWKVSLLRWYSPPAGVWMLGGTGTVFFLCMLLGKRPYYWPNTEKVNFGNSPPIATRSGWMSIACLPFVLMLAAKENPISLVTGVPHEQLMVFHRWVSWAMFVLALVHTFPFVVYNMSTEMIEMQWKTSVFWWTGTIALVAQAWLQFMSLGILRNKFYETFRSMHYVMAAVFFVFLFLHCDYTLTSWDYMIAAAVLYAACLFTSQTRTFIEHGVKQAALELSAADTIRITIPTSSSWSPGQHIFIRFLLPSLHGLTSHPFTICSLPSTSPRPTERDEKPISTNPREATNEMVFYIRPRDGLTARLAALARQQPGRKLRVLLDGPYGGMKKRSPSAFDRLVVAAGGAGAGFTLPVLESFLRGRARADDDPVGSSSSGSDGEGASPPQPPQLELVLAVRTEAERGWAEREVGRLLKAAPARTAALVAASVYVTGGGKEEEEGEEQAAPATAEGDTSSVHVVRGRRPDLPRIVREAAEAARARGEALGVVVCGPGGMLFDVRRAAAAAQVPLIGGARGEVHLYAEHFSW